jgi:hypothetical protein
MDKPFCVTFSEAPVNSRQGSDSSHPDFAGPTLTTFDVQTLLSTPLLVISHQNIICMAWIREFERSILDPPVFKSCFGVKRKSRSTCEIERRMLTSLPLDKRLCCWKIRVRQRNESLSKTVINRRESRVWQRNNSSYFPPCELMDQGHMASETICRRLITLPPNAPACAANPAPSRTSNSYRICKK